MGARGGPRWLDLLRLLGVPVGVLVGVLTEDVWAGLIGGVAGTAAGSVLVEAIKSRDS